MLTDAVFILLLKLLFHIENSLQIDLSTSGISNNAVLIASMTGFCG